MSDADIDRMVKEAEANKEADKKKRESIETKNQAETMIHSIDKQLSEHGDKLSEQDKSAIETAKSNLEQAVKDEDTEKMQSSIKELTEASMKLGEAVYKNQQSSTDSESKQEENVVDADYEEVKK